MAVLKFPQTVAAVQKRDKCLWEIGKALLDECGEPSSQGKRDGSYKKLEQVYQELKGLNITDYSVTFLARVREVAFAFPTRTSRREVSWSVHEEAGNPEMLDEIIKGSKGHTVTRDHARAMKPLVKKAKAKAKREQRIAEGIAGPETDTSEPVAEPDISYLADLAAATAEANAARAKIKSASKNVAPWLDDLDSDMTSALVETLLSVAAEARELADVLRKRSGNKRGHIALVS